MPYAKHPLLLPEAPATTTGAPFYSRFLSSCTGKRERVNSERERERREAKRHGTARRYDNFLVTYVHYARPPLINFKVHSSSSAHSSNTERRRSLFVPAINLRAELIRKRRRRFALVCARRADPRFQGNLFVVCTSCNYYTTTRTTHHQQQRFD